MERQQPQVMLSPLTGKFFVGRNVDDMVVVVVVIVVVVVVLGVMIVVG